MSILHVAFLGCSVGLSAGLLMVLLARGEAVRNFVLALAMAGLMACATGCGGAPTATASQSVTATDGGAADGGRAVVEARCDGNGPYICCRNDLTIP